MPKAMPSTDLPPNQWPVWFNGKSINETIFCRQFLVSHPTVYTDGAFFTVEGRMTDESVLQSQIYDMLQCCASTSVTKKIGNIIDLLKITARVDELVPQDDRIHVANGTRCWTGISSHIRIRLSAAVSPSTTIPKRGRLSGGSASWGKCSTRRTFPPCRSSSGTA